MVAVILIGEADSKLALLRRVGLGSTGALGSLSVLAHLSSAGVAARSGCAIVGDNLASFELESVRVDDAVDLSGSI